MFPIYYDDLTEEEKETGKQIILPVESAISDGGQFAVTITPTDGLYASIKDDEQSYWESEEAGDPVTVTLTAHSEGGMVGLQIDCGVSEESGGEPLFTASIISVYQP